MKNEKRLIDCEQAKRATYEEIFWTESEQAAVRYFLAKLPKVDAVEVVHGRWIDQSFAMNGGVVRFCICSECRHEMTFETNYCPNCGAKMDGERNA